MVYSEAIDVFASVLSLSEPYSLFKQIPIDFRGLMPEYKEQGLNKPWCDLMLICFFCCPQWLWIVVLL